MDLFEEYLAKQDNEYVEFEISSIRPNKNVMIIKFKGIDSINDILPYMGIISISEIFKAYYRLTYRS